MIPRPLSGQRQRQSGSAPFGMTAFRITTAGSLSGTLKSVPSGSSSVFIRSAGIVQSLSAKSTSHLSYEAGFAGPHSRQDNVFGRLMHRRVGAFSLGVERPHNSRHFLVGCRSMMAFGPLGLRQQRLQRLPHGRVLAGAQPLRLGRIQHALDPASRFPRRAIDRHPQRRQDRQDVVRGDVSKTLWPDRLASHHEIALPVGSAFWPLEARQNGLQMASAKAPRFRWIRARRPFPSFRIPAVRECLACVRRLRPSFTKGEPARFGPLAAPSPSSLRRPVPRSRYMNTHVRRACLSVSIVR